MAQEIFIELPDDKFIHAIFAKPSDVLANKFSKSLIIAIHSFPGSMSGAENVFEDLETRMIDGRHAMLRFDFRNCGKSDGQSSDFSLVQAAQDIKTIILWAQNQGYEKITLLTEGLAAMFIAHEPLPPCVKTLVMLWPVADTREMLERYFKIDDNLPKLTAQGFYNHKNMSIGKEFIDNMQALDPLRRLKRLTLPTLVFHGKEDMTVPIANLTLIREHLGANRIDITTFDDGTHGLPLPNHRKAIATHILHFIERFSLK